MNPSPDSPPRMDRRAAIKWMLTAAASVAVLERIAPVYGQEAEAPVSSGASVAAGAIKAKGYGPDPSMVKIYNPGDLWPLTFTEAQRATATALCDLMIPADDLGPAASAVGVPDFIDEWVSSPYPEQAPDRKTVLNGFAWLDAEANRRFQKAFSALSSEQQGAICDDICDPTKAKPENKPQVAFFKKYRDLTAGGYYTTPQGMQAIGYVGNMPLTAYPGPTVEALKHVGLA